MTASEIERRPIPGHPHYLATANGDIVSTRNTVERHLRPFMLNGTLRVSITDGDGKRANNKAVRHLVLAAFHGPRPSPEHIGRHLDNDPTNNRPDNLTWCTRGENSAAAVRRGTHVGVRLGENHNAAKLTNAEVIEIAQRLRAGNTCKSIARDFNLAKQTVSGIKCGRSWSHLTNATLHPATDQRAA